MRAAGSDADETWRALSDSLEQTWTQLDARLAGLTDTEALWEPVADCWSVRASPNGSVTADWLDGPDDPDPAPVTTIAWRLWHIAVDCLDSYSARAFDRTGTGLHATAWVLETSRARDLLRQAWQVFVAGLETRAPDGLYELLGPQWRGDADKTYLALALHAQREVVHHGAEIALLRDLYRGHGLGS
ncbi:MAG TPA: DinB family protein [Acidimicrobiia bacterium]|nr:DinB family protein [Acidimicrobiia bacterium]